MATEGNLQMNPNKTVWRASSLLNTRRRCEGGGGGQGLRALYPFPTPHSKHLVHLAVGESDVL